ncbi:hypothetical protein DL691_25465 [Escherichia coli]|uniref:hypothetical protein n=1 Tax=Escherichia coli TaxID=562 RepID=UPI0007751408|nr:hypothetical protein [Escherichia coli]EGD9106683.1 hypothetical protein [Escherichia coli]EGE2361707.1 hypothetical protein [Escherichia coli]KXP89807.1 hypothetical protein AUP77_02020 [Escherichia coli]
MSKNIEIKNASTELFYDLAKRSFEASWKTMQDMCSDSISHLVDDTDFMSAFIQITINHICHNFDKLTTQERTPADIEDINFEEIAEKMVRNAWVFC